MRACMRARVCASMYACVCERMFVCACVRACEHACVSAHVCVCVRVRLPSSLHFPLQNFQLPEPSVCQKPAHLISDRKLAIFMATMKTPLSTLTCDSVKVTYGCGLSISKLKFEEVKYLKASFTAF